MERHTPQIFSRLAATLVLTTGAIAQTTLYDEDFTEASDWTLTTDCAETDAWWWVNDTLVSAAGAPPSAPNTLNFNNGTTSAIGNYACGRATSPAIDLSSAAGLVTLEFQMFWRHEARCLWDRHTLRILDAASDAVLFEVPCLSDLPNPFPGWRHESFPLNSSWGAVRVQFDFDSLDDWNPADWGIAIDDLRVTDHGCASAHLCEGYPQSGGAPAPSLTAIGTASLGANSLRVRGDGFPTNAYAASFAGTTVAVLPAGGGVRCIGASPSVRLSVAPTRDDGRPLFRLDLNEAPLASMATIGTTLHFQTYFRDGASFNFSDAISVLVCE